MRTSTVVICVLAALPAAPADAQHRAPTGVQHLERSAAMPSGMPAPARDTVERMDPVLGIVGGVVGAAAGGFLGGMAGAATASGCSGEYCAFGPALLGAGLGESFGLAIGTHYGARGRGSVPLSALTSFSILLGGLLVGAAAPRGTPSIALALIPAAQIAAALALER